MANYYSSFILNVNVLSGATVDATDKDNNTPLHIASRRGHELLINTLLGYNADPNRFAFIVKGFYFVKNRLFLPTYLS